MIRSPNVAADILVRSCRKPLHEAARAGRTDVVEYLLEKGAEVNERTNENRGATPLWWAEHALPENHPTIQVLRQHGGAAIGPND